MRKIYIRITEASLRRHNVPVTQLLRGEKTCAKHLRLYRRGPVQPEPRRGDGDIRSEKETVVECRGRIGFGQFCCACHGADRGCRRR